MLKHGGIDPCKKRISHQKQKSSDPSHIEQTHIGYENNYHITYDHSQCGSEITYGHEGCIGNGILYGIVKSAEYGPYIKEFKGPEYHDGQGDSLTPVLKGINLDLSRGEFCVLLGPSGSGKSTLLNIIGGIDRMDSGTITIHGDLMNQMNEKQLTSYRRSHLGYVFQSYNLIPNLTVRENIEVGAYLSADPLSVDDLLHTLGLYDHRNKLPNQLSGGQQQRTAIGRAVVKNPDILLCDEPTGALDYTTSKEILKLIETVNQLYKSTVIMVTHNDALKDMADRVVRLKDGTITKNYQNEHKLPSEELEW